MNYSIYNNFHAAVSPKNPHNFILGNKSLKVVIVQGIISPVGAAGGVEAPLDLVNALHHELPEPLEHSPLHLAGV